jgi:hypothetical protein
MMQGAKVAIPVITAIIALDGDVSRDGVARFEVILAGIKLPVFDELAAGT